MFIERHDPVQLAPQEKREYTVLVDLNGYLLITPEASLETYAFVAACNKLIPADWSNLYKNGADLVTPKYKAGRKLASQENPFTGGIDANRMVYLRNLSPELETHMHLSYDLLGIMQDEKDEYLRRQAAKFALYIFAPLMRTYENHEMQASLQDEAFRILDPVHYQETLTWVESHLGTKWNDPSLLEYPCSVMKSILNTGKIHLKDKCTIHIRRKSLLAIAQKKEDGRSMRDIIALTAEIDDDLMLNRRSEPKYKRLSHHQKISDFIHRRIIRELRRNGVIFTEIDDFIEKGKYYNTEYRLIDTTCILPRPNRPDYEIEIRIVSKSQHTSHQIDHFKFKVERHLYDHPEVDNALLLALSDDAQARTKFLNHGGFLKNYYLLPDTAKIIENYQRLCDPELYIGVVTSSGNHFFFIPRYNDKNEEHSPQEICHLLLEELRGIGSGVSIKGFELFRTEVINGKMKQITYQIILENGAVYQGSDGLTWHAYTANVPFTLQTFDKITALGEIIKFSGEVVQRQGRPFLFPIPTFSEILNDLLTDPQSINRGSVTDFLRTYPLITHELLLYIREVFIELNMQPSNKRKTQRAKYKVWIHLLYALKLSITDVDHPHSKRYKNAKSKIAKMKREFPILTTLLQDL